MHKLSNYFNISVDELLGGLNKIASPPSSDSENAKYKEIFSMIDFSDEKTVSRLTELLYLASLPDEDYDRVMAVLRIVAPAAQS